MRLRPAPLVLLDEPASGPDSAQTERLAQTLRTRRDDLGLSIPLLEHHVGLVMALCDYVYVLDQGLPIAEGTPKQVRNIPAVVAAYLGETTPAA